MLTLHYVEFTEEYKFSQLKNNNNHTNCDCGHGGGDKHHYDHQLPLLPPQALPPPPYSGSVFQILVRITVIVKGINDLMKCLLMAPYWVI
jgi:hypothetical protein